MSKVRECEAIQLNIQRTSPTKAANGHNAFSELMMEGKVSAAVAVKYLDKNLKSGGVLDPSSEGEETSKFTKFNKKYRKNNFLTYEQD